MTTFNHFPIGPVASGDNWQVCKFPVELLDVVSTFHYMENWSFSLEHLDRGQGSHGLTLVIELQTPNSYTDPKRRRITVHHLFPVPPAAYNRQSWRRWLLEMILLVHTHEACEFFEEPCPKCEGAGWLETDFDTHTTEPCDGQGCHQGFVKPFAPNHGPGYDPYRIVEYENNIARTTLFTGEVKDG